MKRYLTIMLVALFVAPILAHAGECGVGGTAKNVSGVEVTKTDAEATAQNAVIREDGYWWTCGKPVKVAPPPAPKDCYPTVSRAFRTWAVEENRCTTQRRGATSPTDPARDKVIRHGQTAIWQQWTGPMRGQLIEMCQDGARTVVAASCRPVTHCDSKWSTSSDGGRTVYVYDARGSNRVPIGQTVMAVAADGRTLQIECTVNGFAK